MSVDSVIGVQPVHDWIMAKNSRTDEIPFEYDLIESGLIDSLSFIEFIFTIEAASGRKIDIENIDIDHFRTLSAINAKYFVE